MRRNVGCLLVAAILVLCASATAHASHQLGGNISWQRDPTYVSTTDARFQVHVEFAFRWSFPWSTGMYPTVGSTFAEDAGGFVFTYGTQSVVIPLVVQSINQIDDWMFGAGDTTITVPLSSLPMTFQFADCCRSSLLTDGNANANFQLATVIAAAGGATRSPRSTLPPRIYVESGSPFDLSLPALVADGLPNQFRFATTFESGLTATTPAGMTLSPDGHVSWASPAIGLYAVQFVVQNSSGAEVPVDVAFKVVAPGQHLSFAPGVCGSNVTVNAGFVTNVPVTVTSPVFGDTITVSSTPLPSGAVFSGSGGNMTFRWTPPLGQGAANICFAGSSTAGLNTVGECCITTQLYVPPHICGVLDGVQVLPADYVSTSTLRGSAALGPSGQLMPINIGQPDGSSGAVWLAGAPQRIANGFALQFKFTLKSGLARTSTNPYPSQGFAMVLQSSGPSARGGAGSSLGYGGIDHSLAVEFDSHPDITQSDPNYEHISVHSRYASPNSALEQYSLGTSVLDNSLPLNFDNNTTQDVRIEYRPADPSQSSGGGPALGWLKAYMNANLVPTVQAQIDDAALAAALGDSAYFGFTASNGGTTDEQLLISDVKLISSLSAGGRMSTPPGSISPGITGQFVVQAVDQCGMAMVSGGDADKWTITLTDGPAPLTAQIVDVGDGTYLVEYTPPVSGTWRANVLFNGAAISGSPFDVNVAPADLPPVLSGVPNDIVAEATGSGTTVSWPQPAANDPESGAVPVTCLPASGGSFSLGSTQISCSASDPAGHVTTATFTVTVKDTTPPAFGALGAIVAEATGPSGAVVTLSASATDLVDGAVSATCSPASGSTFALGTTTVTCTATDAHGNTSSAPLTVTVHDTTPPELAAGADLVVEATGPSGATVNYAAPAALDLVGGNLSGAVHCTPASGSTFALGTTTVSCSVADGAGNTATGSFKVKVFDSTGPVFSAPSNLIVEAASASGTLVTFASPLANDAVEGPVPVSCVPGSGSLFPVGDTVVQCMASDSPGNVTTKTFTVTVADTTPPLLVLPATVTAEATGSAGAAVSFVAAATDAVDGVDPIHCSASPGDTFPIGATAVQCFASDQHGNTSTGGFTVVVKDSTAPAIAGVPGAQTVVATSAAGAVVTYGLPTATDLVDGGVVVQCAPASGATFPLGATTVTCTAQDAAGNTTSATFTVTVRDDRGPVFGPTPSPTAYATSASGAIVSYVAPTATDDVDGPRPVTCTPASGSMFAPGSTTVSCAATDTGGNTASVTFAVKVTYQAPTDGSFYGQPVNGDGSSIFKLGSTVPVKFALTGASAGITTLVAKIYVAKVSDGIEGTLVEATSNGAADGGNTFRYSGGQYIFNLSTKSLTTGTWVVKADLGDGVEHAVHISLK